MRWDTVRGRVWTGALGAVVGLVVVGACGSSDPGTGQGRDAALVDGMVGDAGLRDGGGSCWSWNPAHFDPCDLSPTGGLELSGDHVYSTDTLGFTSGSAADPASAIMAQADGTEAVIIAVTDFTITSFGSLRVEGARPLIVAAAGPLVVEGWIDVSSVRLGSPGAGANSELCVPAESGEPRGGGAGGSGGGGFQGAGGAGGPGDADGSSPSAGGAGGAAVAEVPTTVRGGCPGAGVGDGGAGQAGAGAGGGAVQLTSQISIRLEDTAILAGGAGGAGASGSRDGGAGGGSGGYIGLDAPTIAVVQSVLAANGGAGGEGADLASGVAGQDSQPDRSAARGGAGGDADGGDGGDGSTNTELEGQPATQLEAGGGGGGGGGAGYIVIRTESYAPNSAIVSPSTTHVVPQLVP